ncbi:MAG: tRNA (N6-threonylcarbamoyladenosine(37)-N6)-methyltransferase TrmO [Candidatus Fimenecus sp.]
MKKDIPMRVIAHIHSDFPEKFGIPRQSGIVDELQSTVVFEPEYRNPDAFRGLEGFSHLWLLWQFSECADKDWSPTVRPPRLGGNTRMGVFATRSPFRPNHIGLSCVRLLKMDFESENAPILHVSGADLMDGTPILDVKPYLPYADSVPNATGGFALQSKDDILKVEFPEELLLKLPAEKHKALLRVLAQDPRPAYQADSERVYGFSFAGFTVRFTVAGEILTVTEVE